MVKIPDKWKQFREVIPGNKSDRLVSFVDLGPTALSLAGIDPPKNMHGKAFLGPHSEKPREFIHAFRGRMDERYDMGLGDVAWYDVMHAMAWCVCHA